MSGQNPNFFDALKFMYNPKKHYKENEALLRRWAKKVYKKDDNTCYRCGYIGVRSGGRWTGRKIDAHHIFPKAQYPHLVYRVDNGICLCRNCHTEDKDSLHSMYGFKRGGMKLLNKWVRVTTRSKEYKLYRQVLTATGAAIILSIFTILLINYGAR